MALLEADVALPVVRQFVDQVREKALGEEVMKSLTPGQVLIKIVHDELVALMGEANEALDLAAQPPAVVLMAGLQGSGKTTSVAKLARWLKDKQKKNVMVVSCDVYRPAAIDQLRTLAAEVGAEFFESRPDQKPLDIARAALDAARKRFKDVLIVDTAGRLHIDEAMMDEIKALHAALKPVETLFVVDTMTGQDAANTATRLRRGPAADRRDPDQDRRRRPRRRGALHPPDHRQADQVPRHRREDLGAGALPPRPGRLAHPRHGRRGLPGGGGAEQGRPRPGRASGQQAQEGQGLRPRRLQGADRADGQARRDGGADGQAAGHGPGPGADEGPGRTTRRWASWSPSSTP